MNAQRRIQRRTNMEAALRYLTGCSDTVANVAKQIGVTRPAAESIVADLVKLGWVENVPTPEGVIAMGRPAAYYKLSSQAGHVLSLDIGAHHVSALTADLSGNILAENTDDLAENTPTKMRIEAALTVSKKTLEETNCGKTWVCVTGSPGVQYQGKVAYFGGKGMPGWQGLQLDQVVSEELGVKVTTVGDCALGARGESWVGAASKHNDVVFILAGIRTGAASVLDGRVRAGSRGAAGLIGEIPQLRWRELEAESFAKSIYTPNQPPDRETMFRQAREGNKLAIAGAAKFGEILGLGTASMIAVIDPECVVLGGQFCEYADLFLPQMEQTIRKLCPFAPSIVVSTLGRRAVALGGIRYALDGVWDRIRVHALNSDYFPAVDSDKFWQ